MFDGRWNMLGHAVTYCATSPSLYLCLRSWSTSKIQRLLPDLIMVTYDAPDSLAIEIIALGRSPVRDWRHQEALTQQRGDAWHRCTLTPPLLQVPSAIMPLAECPGSQCADQSCAPGRCHDQGCRLGAVLVRPPTDLTVLRAVGGSARVQGLGPRLSHNVVGAPLGLP